MAPDSAELVAKIYNAAWMVRHYRRGGSSIIQRRQRKRAIKDLGLAVRYAFSVTSDFEPLLIALHDGLNQNRPPPF